MLRKVVFLLFSAITLAALSHAQETRHFVFHYSFTVRNIPVGERVRIWIPAAESNDFQEVRVVRATGDLPLKRTHESKYGNQMYFAQTSKAKKRELHFEIVYDVVRHERIVLGTYAPHLASLQLKDKERNEFLAPDRLVPVTGEPAKLAISVTKTEATPLDKAHAIYDYVFANMSYDKTGTGWGRGDALYACAAKKGNCTDFHSLFIAMARSQGIPARFEIGFPLPAAAHSGEIAGYHCWADFFEPQHGWVPVDISEAWQHPEKRSYFFGALDANRVQFAMGRDLRLSPAQNGPPLNYFVYPYVEVAGKVYSNVAQAFSFEDAGKQSSMGMQPAN
ncbi:MAG: transglutaminase-like domain-containing protein [Terriglobales bacterium]